MKKLFFSLSVIALLASCEKQEIAPNISNNTTFENTGKELHVNESLDIEGPTVDPEETQTLDIARKAQ